MQSALLRTPFQPLREAALACPSSSSSAVPPPRPSWQNCPWLLPLVPTTPCACLYLHSSHAITSICLSSCLPHQMVVPSMQGPNLNDFSGSRPQLQQEHKQPSERLSSPAAEQNKEQCFSLHSGGPPATPFPPPEKLISRTARPTNLGERSNRNKWHKFIKQCQEQGIWTQGDWQR